ncbi:helix-turn-helix transcriptional regulator [Zhihengliuella halotolerans]|uniref:helix-turn-helix transcriptional regulator n=1 Tax=Zhihengliuella halotolerans TaxID=370736 RepID=UPI000C806E01|nr:helix-turn-helix transcriptional regulator [Zhihengliuella halotolerans]
MDVNRIVAEGLRRSVEKSGLSQGSFAHALGTSPTRFSTYVSGEVSPSAATYVRAEILAEAIADAERRGLMTALDAARALREPLRRRAEPDAWRMLLQGRDHLRLLLESGDGTAWEARPQSCGDRRWDALLAALAEHEFSSAGQQPPRWTERARLSEDWMPDHPFMSPERVRRQTPEWLAERSIFVPAKDLVTA